MGRQYRNYGRNLALFLILMSLSSCSTVGYLWQACLGQLKMSNRSRSIDDVLRDPKTSSRLKALLSEIPAIKTYGEKMGLRPTKNYTNYVAWDDAAVSWVVSACEPLEFKAREWKFPIVGSFNYLGWFHREPALAMAQDLKSQGLDVDVRGAQAYSTLGWFHDPIVSTMISEGPEAFGRLINVVLHESVHATFYVSGQSTFNESLAVFVADAVSPGFFSDWKAESLDGKSKQELLKAYMDAENYGEKVGQEFKVAYAELDRLYKSDSAKEQKLESKKRILTSLKEKLNFRRDISNATLIQFRTYGSGQDEFKALFQRSGNDWKEFWKRLEALRQDPKRFKREQNEDFGKVLNEL